MGKMNHVINRYLDDERRFADLFNGIWFRGEGIISPENLQDCSERYIAEAKGHDANGRRAKGLERFRDIKKRLSDGKTLRLLTIENQNLVDYAMPFRCMEYDTLEYQKQLDNIRKINKEEGHFSSPAERLCGVRKTDRLTPVYTICLYHGEEKWDGPRTLKDMMAFGGEEDKFLPYFSDYPMQLYCANELEDFSVFHTELRVFLAALRYRKDRESLEKFVHKNGAYSHLDDDTAEAVSIIMNKSVDWRNEKHRFKNDKGEYDMGNAWQEWLAEEKEAGRQEGRQEGVFETLCSLIKDGLLQLEEAAKRSHMSVEDFRARMEQTDL